MILPSPVSTIAIPRNVTETALFRKLTCTFGLLTILTSSAGIVGNIYGITPLSSVCPGCKTLALSAAIVWIFFGAVLVFISIKPVSRSVLLILRAVLVIIACTEAFEIVSSLTGRHFFVESWFIAIGSIAFGPQSSPISPVAAGLIILAAAGLFFYSDPAFSLSQGRRIREGTVAAGIISSIAGFTLVLSYFYGDPLFYGTPVIPIAALSALAAFFIGAGLDYCRRTVNGSDLLFHGDFYPGHTASELCHLISCHHPL